jgi:hypothetical protein
MLSRVACPYSTCGECSRGTSPSGVITLINRAAPRSSPVTSDHPEGALVDRVLGSDPFSRQLPFPKSNIAPFPGRVHLLKPCRVLP